MADGEGKKKPGQYHRRESQQPVPRGMNDKKPRDPPERADVKAALALVDKIVTTIGEDVKEWKILKNQDYFESTEEKAKAIGETIRASGQVTDGQRTALENMLAGVEKWVD